MALLKKLLGKRIISVKRQLFQDDMGFADCEQDADGPVEFAMSDGSIMHFIWDAETFSIGVAPGKMPLYECGYVLQNVTDNIFWRDRVSQEIKKLTLLKYSDFSDNYPSEFGIEVSFANNKKVLIEYKDEENYPDMIRVVDHYSGQACIKQLVE